MQQVRRSYTSGKLPVDINVFGIDHIADPDLRGYRLRTFVYPSADGNMRVLIDNPRREVFARCIDDQGVACRKVLPDSFDFSTFDQNISGWHDTLFFVRPYRRIFEKNRLRAWQLLVSIR